MDVSEIKQEVQEAQEIHPIKAHWEDPQMPHFFVKTGTPYYQAPIAEFQQRGYLKNRLFENLCEHLPEGVFIAGGFMRAMLAGNTTKGEMAQGDIDFFFTTPKALENMMALLKDPPKDAWAYTGYTLATQENSFKHDHGKALRYILYKHAKYPSIQLIKLAYYDCPQDVIDAFDFTIVQFATDGKNIVFSPMGLEDLHNQRLVLHRMQFPASTLRRTIKYAQKGYYACPGSLEKITQAIHDIIQQFPELVGAIVYVD